MARSLRGENVDCCSEVSKEILQKAKQQPADPPRIVLPIRTYPGPDNGILKETFRAWSLEDSLKLLVHLDRIGEKSNDSVDQEDWQIQLLHDPEQ